MKGVRLWRQDFSEVAPDGENDERTWDCKALSRQAIVGIFVRCELKYRAYSNGRRFHLCLFDPTRRGAGDLIVIRAEEYEELLYNQRTGRLMFGDAE